MGWDMRVLISVMLILSSSSVTFLLVMCGLRPLSKFMIQAIALMIVRMMSRMVITAVSREHVSHSCPHGHQHPGATYQR